MGRRPCSRRRASTPPCCVSRSPARAVPPWQRCVSSTTTRCVRRSSRPWKRPPSARKSLPPAMPESQAVTVLRLVADDWQAYRAIRLAMLQESPSAFGSTHEEAVSFDEPLWQQRLTDNVVFLARVGRTPAGSAVFSEYGVTDPDDCSLFGMWVDPAFRGTGVARAL